MTDISDLLKYLACPTCFTVTTRCKPEICQLECLACRENAIKLVKGRALIDPKGCNLCGECPILCPRGAIDKSSLYYKEDFICTTCGRRYKFKNNIVELYNERFNQDLYNYYNYEYPDSDFHYADREIKAGKILNILPKRKYETVLDIGSGSGSVLITLEENISFKRKIYLDISLGGLRKISFNDTDILILGDAEHLPLKRDSIHLSLVVDVLEHLRDPKRALVDLRRVSKEILIKSPLDGAWSRKSFLKLLNLFYGPTSWKKAYGHIQRFTRKNITELITSSGFLIEAISITDLPSRSVSSIYKIFHLIQTTGYHILPKGLFERLFGGDITIFAGTKRSGSYG